MSGFSSLADQTPWQAYTPTIDSTVNPGTMTIGSLSAWFKKIGKSTFYSISFAITATGTAAGAMTVTLPTNAQHPSAVLGLLATGELIAGFVVAGSNTANITKYTGATPIQVTTIYISGVCESP